MSTCGLAGQMMAHGGADATSAGATHIGREQEARRSFPAAAFLPPPSTVSLGLPQPQLPYIQPAPLPARPTSQGFTTYAACATQQQSMQSFAPSMLFPSHLMHPEAQHILNSAAAIAAGLAPGGTSASAAAMMAGGLPETKRVKTDSEYPMVDAMQQQDGEELPRARKRKKSRKSELATLEAAVDASGGQVHGFLDEYLKPKGANKSRGRPRTKAEVQVWVYGEDGRPTKRGRGRPKKDQRVAFITSDGETIPLQGMPPPPSFFTAAMALPLTSSTLSSSSSTTSLNTASALKPCPSSACTMVAGGGDGGANQHSSGMISNGGIYPVLNGHDGATQDGTNDGGEAVGKPKPARKRPVPTPISIAPNTFAPTLIMSPKQAGVGQQAYLLPAAFLQQNPDVFTQMAQQGYTFAHVPMSHPDMPEWQPYASMTGQLPGMQNATPVAILNLPSPPGSKVGTSDGVTSVPSTDIEFLLSSIDASADFMKMEDAQRVGDGGGDVGMAEKLPTHAVPSAAAPHAATPDCPHSRDAATAAGDGRPRMDNLSVNGDSVEGEAVKGSGAGGVMDGCDYGRQDDDGVDALFASPGPQDTEG